MASTGFYHAPFKPICGDVRCIHCGFLWHGHPLAIRDQWLKSRQAVQDLSDPQSGAAW